MLPKFAYGPPNPHILSSGGPSKDNLHFYSTTYSNIFKDDREREDKPLSSLRHKYSPISLRVHFTQDILCFFRGTGYTANFRPAIYYSPKQDAVDNPPMR